MSISQGACVCFPSAILLTWATSWGSGLCCTSSRCSQGSAIHPGRRAWIWGCAQIAVLTEHSWLQELQQHCPTGGTAGARETLWLCVSYRCTLSSSRGTIAFEGKMSFLVVEKKNEEGKVRPASVPRVTPSKPPRFSQNCAMEMRSKSCVPYRLLKE